MTFTGIAGMIMSYAILITAYSALILGLFQLWSWLLLEVAIGPGDVFTLQSTAQWMVLRLGKLTNKKEVTNGNIHFFQR